MVKKLVGLIAFFSILVAQAQVDSLRYKKKTLAVSDSIAFHTTSTNPYFFRLTFKNGQQIDSLDYKVDYQNSKLFLNATFFKKFSKVDSIQVHYYTYPNFLTQNYSGLDTLLIRANASTSSPIPIHTVKKPLRGKPLEGLDTQGNITRGITIGNNHDAVLNSVLDLKIEGKLSSKVTLRARISDTNIPIQENGYSQDLKDLDRVYIEMQAPNWSVRAGDVFLKDTTSYFMRFNKKVAGVAIASHSDNLKFTAAGALVRGRYTEHHFQGKEANQGPYKLNGNNGEAYIFIISGSEKVFINGLPQKRGEDNDYIIDYNTAEITFTATKPITSDMRIQVEFQYSDRNYSRFVTHETANYTSDKWQIGVSYYNESDLKNQPLQLSLTDKQIELLAQMGNSTEQLFVTNAVETSYDEKKILYKKIVVSGVDVYEYSIDPDDTLYHVGFTYVGTNQGDYQVLEYLAIGKKMEYVGVNNGDYQAKTPLVAPSKQQIISLQTKYQPNKKTDVSIDLAYADNDRNLFSTLDNSGNKAPAIKASWNQVLLDSTKRGWKLESKLQFDFLHKDFKSIERLYTIEFDRDWNLEKSKENQRLFNGRLLFSNPKKGELFYNFENLNFNNSYNGNRQSLGANMHFNKFNINHLSSLLMSQGSLINSDFTRSHTQVKYTQKKWWIGSVFDLENNKQKEVTTSILNTNSYKFIDAKALFGIGDSAKVFVELGGQIHINDSLISNQLKTVNRSKTVFINSQLIKDEHAQLKFYANYRLLDNLKGKKVDVINSKLTYNQQLFNQFVVWNTSYQNTSGNSPQRDYTYVETEVGQGFYTWIDYNENGLQELDEFEIALYNDQANFLRIALPNITYLPTQEAKLQQNLQVNFSKWSNQKGFKKLLSHWYNQFTILAKNNQFRQGNLVNINPFDNTSSQTVNNQFVLRNSLVFNRGKAHYTTTYNYNKSQQKTALSFGSQENNLENHQILFQHKIKENWQIGLLAEQIINTIDNENFTSRNYRIVEQSIAPNLSYFFNKSHWIKASYSNAKKNNRIGDLESLDQQQIALNYQFTSKDQNSLFMEIKAIKNNFIGSSFSSVGYQMLEGLQPDNNMTWNLLWTHKLNSFLYVNLNYNGRTNAFSKTIHNGNVQLRASF